MSIADNLKTLGSKLGALAGAAAGAKSGLSVPPGLPKPPTGGPKPPASFGGGAATASKTKKDTQDYDQKTQKNNDRTDRTDKAQKTAESETTRLLKEIRELEREIEVIETKIRNIPTSFVFWKCTRADYVERKWWGKVYVYFVDRKAFYHKDEEEYVGTFENFNPGHGQFYNADTTLEVILRDNNEWSQLTAEEQAAGDEIISVARSAPKVAGPYEEPDDETPDEEEDPIFVPDKYPEFPTIGGV
jgi:hypothetical protein